MWCINVEVSHNVLMTSWNEGYKCTISPDDWQIMILFAMFFLFGIVDQNEESV